MSGDQAKKNLLRIVPEASESLEATAKPASEKPEEDEAVCPRCFGTGMHVEPGKGARRCRCLTSSNRQKLLDAARIPIRYADCSLGPLPEGVTRERDYKSANESQKMALRFAHILVKDYPAVDRGLLFMGTVGVGKTHLAVGILKGLVAKGVPCLFCEFGSLLKEIQNSYNAISKTSALEVLAPIYQTEVLVLDELGAALPTDWVRETMYQIINTRYNHKRLTIFTTNYWDEARIESHEETASSQRSKKKPTSRRIHELTTLEERIGTPLRSRIYEMCNKIVITGEDYRKVLDRERFDPNKL